MDTDRRQFLKWSTMLLLYGTGLTLTGCGGKGFMAGALLQPPAQGKAKPLQRPAHFDLQDDLCVGFPSPGKAKLQDRLIGFGQITDVHITLEQFKLTGHPKLEALLAQFGESIGFGGLDRPEIQEKFDLDVLRSMVKTLNASEEMVDFVIHTGDSVDIGTTPEMIGFLSEMNYLSIPWFQTIGNHDVLGLGNIPPGMLEAFTDLKFMDKQEFIRKHFPEEGEVRLQEAFGSRAKGFDFSPGAREGIRFEGYYAFTALPPIAGSGKQIIRPGVRFYVLETVSPRGSAGGALDSGQIQWLRGELEKYPAHLAVIVSHHALEALGSGRSELQSLLLSQPNVIALVAGHSHLNNIRAIPSPAGDGQGFWQIQTSSLIDFPQQGRIIEILNNGDGTGSIRTFVFNQQVGGQLGKNARASLASAAMQRFDGSGSEKDRNVTLMFRMPSWVG
jgi:3',5'-cyclic AMP phosphodiesterase CpdA